MSFINELACTRRKVAIFESQWMDSLLAIIFSLNSQIKPFSIARAGATRAIFINSFGTAAESSASTKKKTNPGTGHADIASIIDQLGKISGAKQWELIRDQFDIASFSIYYAVNMCIENWDGFFNNYFVYHNPDAGVKWQIIPWDEDKTWGEYDGGPRNYSWYDMPLTIGMKGDTGTRSWFGGGPFGGGAGWWRPPGWFSGPLLGNPEFRKLFLARLRIICSNVFTEEQFGPVVDELHKRLRPEVELRARALHQDPAAALRKFDADIQSFHAQLRHRRAYILKELK